VTVDETRVVRRRVVQGLIDRLLAVLLGVGLAVLVVIGLQALGVAEDPVAQAAAGTFVGVLAIGSVLNEVLLPWRNGGASVGMKVTRLRVMMLDGSAPGLKHYFVRHLLWVVDGFLWGLVALVVMVRTPYRQRVGDLAAGTVVVSADEAVLPGGEPGGNR
jgi:uncharacterized RDD family membrane protein YckC